MRRFIPLVAALAAVPASAQLGPPASVGIGATIALPAATALTDTLSIASSPATVFYRDLPGTPPTVVRLGDRVTIGLANKIPMSSSPAAAQQTWAGALYGMGWMERDSTLAVFSTAAGNSVASAARTSDRKLNGISAFAYTGFAVADTASSVAEGAYLEARTTSPSSSAYGLEIDAVNNAGPPPVTNPYVLNASGGAYGLMLGAGGDPNIGATTYPSSFAIGIGANKTTWSRGLVFGSASLLGDNGVIGTAVAVGLAKGHQIQWGFDYTDVPSAFIRSDGTAAGLGLVFNNSGLIVQNTAGTAFATFANAGGLTVNGNIAATALNGTTTTVNQANVYGNALVTGTASIGNISLGGTTVTGYPTLDIDGAAGAQRQTTLSTAGTLRWAYGAQSGEPGGNAGADFFISAFTDSGSGLGNDLVITRATGQVAVTHGLSVANALTTGTLTVTNAHTPATSSETCSTGQHSWDANYAYICVSANNWKRAALSTW